jgi:hypothetical protein
VVVKIAKVWLAGCYDNPTPTATDNKGKQVPEGFVRCRNVSSHRWQHIRAEVVVAVVVAVTVDARQLMRGQPNGSRCGA